ncbi:MAG: AAA family ATPase [Deltaproteobacteria bacterium]|jgi:chromosome segregation protein|nr:AAA family ATPase [Deltaproteobacteria bacterium]
MFLKRLDIVGFKSFTERSSVPFSPGISAVVGPNGCGKSNIIDAIRWVMGEQSPRLLRARNMEDILFNGSKGKSPAALAEVTLTLSRDESERGSAEISVTRRLFRGGDSDYFINRVQSRLKDVLRFFIEAGMGTRSYAIIEQERVGRLVDARPEERRLLMDEAAGITRYKEQKKESERKLETASQNLATVAAIMSESKKQLAVVQRAAAKAARYRAVKTELRDLELAVSAGRFLELCEKARTLSEEAALKKDLLAASIAGTAEIEAETETLKLEDNRAAQLLEEELAGFHTMDGDYARKKTEAQHLEENLKSSLSRKEKAAEELSGLDAEKENYESDKERLSALIETLAADHQAAVALEEKARADHAALKEGFDKLQSRLSEAAREEEDLRDKLARQNETLAGSESLIEHLRERRRALELERNESEITLTEARERINSRARFKQSLQEELSSLEDDLSALRAEEAEKKNALENLVKELTPAESQAAALKAKLETLESLQASHAWYPRGAGELLKEESLTKAGLLGPVAENIEIPEGYEEAAEAALGDRLSFLAVKDRGAALAALKFARENSLGRCGFITGGFRDKNAFTRDLLGSYELLESSEDMEKLPAEGVFLTRDGAYISPELTAGGNSASGGKEAEEAGILTRLREKEKTARELASALEKLEELKRAADLASAARREAAEALDSKIEERGNLNSDLAEASSKHLVAVSEEKGLAIRHDSLDSEIKQVDLNIASAEKKREESAGQREALEKRLEESRGRLNAVKEESSGRAEALGELRERENTASLNAGSVKDKLESARRELTGVNSFLGSLSTRKVSLEKEIKELALEMESIGEKMELLKAELELFPEKVREAEERLNGLREERAKNRGLLETKEEEFREARRGRERTAEELNALEKDLLEASFGLEQLKENILKDWWVVYRDPYAPEAPETTEEPLEEPETAAGPEEESPAADAAGDFAENEDNPEASGAPSPETADPAGEPAEGGPPPLEKQASAGESEESVRNGQNAPEGSESDGQEPAAVPPPELLDPRELVREDLPKDAADRVARLKSRLGSIGEVNLAAIEEEAELKKRYEFYQAQYDDLDKAIGDLRDTINHINQVCRERFNTTFAEVDAKFQEIFPVLFEGGEGWLALSEHSDPLEAGVEIHVHPPGKKIMVMSLLSGGEKALTALALIFALYLIKPSPFCLLDEADAPLDEANIDRFNRLLRKLSESSQIIMVTHNKRTMQISDTLYGVTMETPGVSRLVSVSLSQAQVLTRNV